MQINLPYKTIIDSFENLSNARDGYQYQEPLKSQSKPQAKLLSKPATLPLHHATHVQEQRDNRDITLLFGTSTTKWINTSFLSDDKTEFINVSQSGARVKNQKWYNKVPDVGTLIDNFAHLNSEKVSRVKQVILSMGTNDIKFLSKGSVNMFQGHIEQLIHSIRYHFGKDVHICIKSVLPMRIMYTYTVKNFLDFNEMLQHISYCMGCTYLDCFGYFLDEQMRDINRGLYVDPFHLNGYGYKVLEKCLKEAVDVDRYYRYLL